MRYMPGLIVISEEADVPILRLVYRAGHLTMRQAYDSAYASGFSKNNWNTFRWRVQRLAQHEFVDTLRVDGLGPVLSLGKNGELLLQGKEPAIVERGSRTGGAKSRDQIWHDVELFDLHLALRRSGVTMAWQFETEIRAQNDFTTFGYRKDYDAIVTFGINGNSVQAALEYERTAKSTREYERICGELNLETRVSTFLFLAKSPQLQSFLAHGFRFARRRLFIGFAESFCNDPRTAELIDVRLDVTRHLEEVLSTSS